MNSFLIHVYFRLGERTFICTAGEDTLIRTHELEPSGKGLSLKFVLRGHVSSIKCMFCLPEKNGSVLMVTGGGRAQLKVWRFRILDGEISGTELADYMLRGSSKAVKRPWRKVQRETRPDPETRFLDIETQEGVEGETYIYVGCSDSVLRIFLYSNSSIVLYREVEFQDHCILKLERFVVRDESFLLSCTTAGTIYVWRTGSVLSPEFDQFRIHQSGINSVDTRRDGDACLLVTGGDDNALVLSRLQCTDGTFSHHTLWREDKAHSAQITGVRFLGTK